jgi:glycosyltransferase involved in cell wall biosynthesis
MMPKAVHLTSAHSPFDVRIFHKECKTLAAVGYEVVLIVPHDHDETVQKVRVRAVPKPERRRERVTRTIWQIYRAALAENADVYHFHDPELLPAALLLKVHGKKVIYDVHEDVPRQVLSNYRIAPWLRRPVAATVALVENVGKSFFDGIVTVTSTINKRFVSRNTVLVRNFPILEEFATTEVTPYHERLPIAAYVGGITAIRGIREMVEAISLTSFPGAQLVLAGTFNPASLEDDMRKLPGWKRTEARGWQAREGIAKLLGEARVGLVTLHPTLSYMDALPIKLFEYMSAGIPVVASDFPLWREIVEESGCGLLVDPLDPKAIADATGWLLEHPDEAAAMGKRGQEAVRAKYNWDVEAQKLLDFYQDLTERGVYKAQLT